MCFYNDDYDWTATVCETTDGPAPAATRCDECGRAIPAGQWRRHVYQQEHEECQVCEDRRSDRYMVGENDEDPPPCADDGHDFGESYEYDCCAECERVLAAVEAVEVAAGCSPYEARPSLGRMREEVGDGEGWRHYADEFARLSPGEYVPWPFDRDVYEDWLIEEFPGYWCDRWGHHQPDDLVVFGGEG